jgi:small subunit ribosomal protein S6
MRHYEVTFIVDPVLSSDEVKATAQKYADMLTAAGYQVIHIDEMGLQQLAYEIKKRHSGMYFCMEFAGENGVIIDKMELTLRRDEKILRFLTVALDKFGVKYNEDKRAGKIGKKNREAIIKKKTDDLEEVEDLVEA